MSADTLLNGRYRLLAQQGSGGMAVIYKAFDESLGRTVAIKILRPSLTADPTFIARFKNEARSIANLGHPNIVTVHDVGSEGQTHYIVMEFVDGRDLKKIIRERGTLPLELALDYAIEISAGLGFAHRKNLVHADVKPQNILINNDNQVKITDFGIAQAVSDSQPVQRQAVVWGSPHYFAPEQAQGERPSTASDVYSIGVVMFEMLTARLPFVGANQQELAMAHIRAPIPNVREFNSAVPDQLADIITKVMSKKPTARYTSAVQLETVLVSLRDYLRQQARPQPSLKPAAPPINTNTDSRPIPPPKREMPPSVTPPPPQQAVPTQRYNPAPDAPMSQVRPIPAPPQKMDSRPFTPNPNAPRPAPLNTDSRPFTQRYPYNQTVRGPEQQELPSVFDGVTIALAVLAFTSVACLIPLYIAVFLART